MHSVAPILRLLAPLFARQRKGRPEPATGLPGELSSDARLGPCPLTPEEVYTLGLFDSEVQRGLMHTNGWRAQMGRLQVLFDAWQGRALLHAPPCPHCNGTGFLWVDDTDPQAAMAEVMGYRPKCKACRGTGRSLSTLGG